MFLILYYNARKAEKSNTTAQIVFTFAQLRVVVILRDLEFIQNNAIRIRVHSFSHSFLAKEMFHHDYLKIVSSLI